MSVPEKTSSEHDWEEIDSRVDDGPWLRFMTFLNWYSGDMDHLEKKLVLKLDLLILPFSTLSYWVKYIDQQSITNSYVSGMKEDIGLTGKDVNFINLVFWLGYIIPMVPLCYLITRTRINIALPSLEIGWGLCTFGCAWAQNIETIYAMRFLTAAFESACYVASMFMIGSWYKPHEIGRRVAILYGAGPIGSMTAGYLEAGTYRNLNGVHGLAGWRWLFIVCTAITIPISLLGFIAFPNVPHSRRPRFMSQKEHELAKARIQGTTAPSQLTFSRDILKRVYGSWQVYLFSVHGALLAQAGGLFQTSFNLYLKAKPQIYSVTQVNTIPTVAQALVLAGGIFAGFSADYLRNFWIPSSTCLVPVLVGIILLIVWHVGESGRIAGFILPGAVGRSISGSLSWATVPGHRYFSFRPLMRPISGRVSHHFWSSFSWTRSS